MAVLYVQHYFQGLDSNGKPLANGKLYTYAAGTTAPKDAYTTAAGDVKHSNPIILDSAGRAIIFLQGSYKFVLKDENDVAIPNGTTDNVSTFTTIADATNSFFQTFSGDGSTSTFTLTQDLGTDEKSVMIFIDNGLGSFVTNGTFSSDTGWTKGSGWTISGGVATATGAISTALSQTSPATLVAGEVYALTYTITASAGTITPSIGGVSGTARSSAGTYYETIIAGSTQTIAFTGSGFTGTIDNVSITKVQSAGFDIQPISAYTLNGTSLTFTSAPKSGSNNIMVFAPSTLVGAASASAAAAAASEANALVAANNASTYATNASNSATSASGYATNASNSATSAATSATNAANSAIQVENAKLIWKGLYSGATTYAVNDAVTYNGSSFICKLATTGNAPAIGGTTYWDDLAQKGASGSLTDGTYGDITVSGGGTIMTVGNTVISLAKIQNATASSKLLGSGSSGSGASYSEITLGTGLTMSGTTLSSSGGDPFTATSTISSTADWDTLTTAGLYITSGTTYVNAPLFNLSTVGYLKVQKRSSDNNNIVQTWVKSSTGETWQRSTSNGGTTWLMWNIIGNQEFYDKQKKYQFTMTDTAYSGTTTGQYIDGMQTTISGSAAGVNLISSHMPVGLDNSSNYCYLDTGSTTTGSASLSLPIQYGQYMSSTVGIRYECKIMVFALSTSSQRYSLSIGALTRATTSKVFFNYTDNENSGNWVCVADNAGTETVVNTAIAPVPITTYFTGYQKMRIELSPSGTAKFYINDVLVGTISTNIANPISFQQLIGLTKSVGGTTCFAYFGEPIIQVIY